MSPIGIIATSGLSPLRLAEKLRAEGRDVVIIGLKSVTDADYSDFRHHFHRVGAIDSVIKTLLQEGVKEIVLSGRFVRPKLASVIPDMRTAKFIGRVFASGDDEALRILKEEFAKDGIAVVDPADLLSHDFAPEGVITGEAPDAYVMASFKHASAYLKAAGQFDVGQCCVVQGRRIIAVEAAEGTDAMLDRAASLIDPDIKPLVLVKMLKSGQDRTLDPPGIGATTVDKAALLGLSHIAVEAGGVVMIDKDKTLNRAKEKGISLFGIPAA